MLSGLPYRILGPEERRIGFPFRSLSLPQTLSSGLDARVAGAAVQNGGVALSRGCGCRVRVVCRGAVDV